MAKTKEQVLEMLDRIMDENSGENPDVAIRAANLKMTLEGWDKYEKGIKPGSAPLVHAPKSIEAGRGKLKVVPH